MFPGQPKYHSPIQANDMNSTRNVDPDELFDLTDLPPPFSGEEEEEEEVLLGEEEDDSTLQKIRFSLQLQVCYESY